MTLTRRSLLAAGAAAAMPLPAAAQDVDWTTLAAEVKGEMRWAWHQYRAVAWGQDEVKPVSGTGQSFLIKGRSVGLSIVEALDTLWLMGLDAELEDAVRWIRQHLTFDLDGDAQLFEASIRLVGGLLSGHLATGERRLLDLAHDLADRMMPCFATPTAMPMRFVNLRNGSVKGSISYPAEIGGGCLPEYWTLSQLTGDRRFYDAALAATLALVGKATPLGLYGDAIDVTTGQWSGRRATVGPPTDSFFEYLWDGWRLTGDVRLRDAYQAATAAIRTHMADRSTGLLWYADVDCFSGARVNADQDELSAFYPGLLAEGGDVATARVHMASWIAAQARYGILPEGFDVRTWTVTQATNALRPELADAAFTLWLHDRDDRWRVVARDHFLAMRRWMKAPHGYSGLTDVRVRPARRLHRALPRCHRRGHPVVGEVAVGGAIGHVIVPAAANRVIEQDTLEAVIGRHRPATLARKHGERLARQDQPLRFQIGASYVAHLVAIRRGSVSPLSPSPLP